MRNILRIILLLMPFVMFASGAQAMNENEMKNMMQQMQKMQTCMQGIDQNKLKQLEQRAKQFESEVKTLCANGSRKKAQAKAISFEKQFNNDATMKAMKKCSEMMQGAIQDIPFMNLDEDIQSAHVCDGGLQ